MDGMLSQEEINALLNGMTEEKSDNSSDAAGAESSAGTTEEPVVNTNDAGSGDIVLTDFEKDTIGEISNISMGTSATTLSSLVNQKVDISVPVVSISNWNDLVSNYDRPCVFLQIQYREGLDGNNILILKDRDVKVIADLMMGGDGTNIEGELGELHLSAICEAMNQMMGSASTSLSSMLNMKIDISPPTASLIDLNETLNEEEIADFLKHSFVKNTFKMKIGDLVNSEMMQIFPIEFAKMLCERITGGQELGGITSEATKNIVDSESAKQHSEPAPQPQETPQPVPQQSQPQQPQQPQQMAGQQPYPQQGYPSQMGYPPQMQGMPYQGMPYQGMPYQAMPQMSEVNVQPAQFQAFTGDLDSVTQKENINLIMDVPLNVTVELGRTSKSIQEILEFAPGTIIELDKIAGEPVDVLVNGKFVAKGEVVVIEESFGVRITEIIK